MWRGGRGAAGVADGTPRDCGREVANRRADGMWRDCGREVADGRVGPGGPGDRRGAKLGCSGVRNQGVIVNSLTDVRATATLTD
jgi:hypothetical protein